MRVLHAVELYRPSVGGAQEVVRQLSERLAARGHDVTVATTALPDREDRRPGGVRIAEFAVAGNAVRGLEGDVDAYRQFVLEGGFDVVMVYAAQQWTLDGLLDVLDRVPCPVVVAPCGFSALHDPDWAGYFSALPALLKHAAALVTHSDTYQDARFLREAGLETTLIANGADEHELARLPDPAQARRQLGVRADAPLLLTVGAHTGEKGHAEALRATRRLSGRAELLVVGNVPLGRGCEPTCRARAWTTTAVSLGRRRGRVVSLSRADTLGAFSAADLFVFASNIECSPIVLFEAAASGTPFVSADVGNAAEIAEWTGGGLIARTARDESGRARVDEADLARLITELLADDERRRAMGAAAREAWQRDYTWDAVTDRYEALYGAVSASRPSTVADSE
jgi:glycosyltransferase involved in cell wall biosynthesis